MQRRMIHVLCCSFILFLAFALFSSHAGAGREAFPIDPAPEQSVQASVEYLNQVMDQYHGRFWVFEDLSSAGNHFHAWAKFFSAGADATMEGAETTIVEPGSATSVRCELTYTSPLGFAGFVMQNGLLPPGAVAPIPNFGTVPDSGILELDGAVALHFRARGEKGGETVDFFIAGVGWDPPLKPFPDSSPAIHIPGTPVPLTAEWQDYTIPLEGHDLSYVLGGFGWGASATNDPDGDGSVLFYVDNIYFELDPASQAERLAQPRFLRSFTTLPVQSLPPPVGDFDFVLRNTAFIYDNALALLAYLAEGSPESLERARLIGEAFEYATQHDRFYEDGRLRDAYSAGDIALPPGWTPNGIIGSVPVSGFFDVSSGTFFEIFQDGISTGNNSWAMIALLALYQATQDEKYLDAARGLGRFVQTFKVTEGRFQGFSGGLDNPEGAAIERVWASTEHNLDVYAAFKVMHEITGEPDWDSDAEHARQFVEAMRDVETGCFLTGTIDPETRNTNPGQLPLDTQSWIILALRDALSSPESVLACAKANHLTQQDGFVGFDFNEDKDGVWFEGTAQMGVAYAESNRAPWVEFLQKELQRAQQTLPFGDGKGIAAASHDGVTTGLDFLLFRRLHVAATSWNVFAQRRFNPYYQTIEPYLALSVNGEHPISRDVLTPGPLLLTLDMVPGTFTTPLDWYFAIVVPGENILVLWVTSAGISTTPAPLVTTTPPLELSDVTLVNAVFSPDTVLTFVFLLVDGTAVTASDFVTARVSTTGAQ